MESDWKAAFNILMDYWDFIPEEERELVDQKLKVALNEQNSPFKTLSVLFGHYGRLKKMPPYLGAFFCP